MRRPQTARISVLLSLLLCAAILAAGCSGSTSVEIGAIRVDVTTVGNNFDADGYVIRVTGNGEDQSQRVGVNGQVLFAANSGRYQVDLTDRAANCVTDRNPQVADVTSGETTIVTFNNLCG